MSSRPQPQPAPPLDLAQFQGFTPGPWSLSFDEDFVESDEGAICEVMPQDMAGDDGEVSEEESRAREVNNAELLAAAPALLAECVRLREREMTLLGLLHEITEDPDKEFDNGGPIPAYALVVRRDCYDAARAALSSTASEPGGAHE